MHSLSPKQVLEIIIQAFGDIEGKTILDIGAGEGYIYDHATPMGAHVTGIDPGLFEVYEVNFTKTLGITFEDFGTAQDIYTHPDHFDAAVCINTFAFMSSTPDMIMKMKDMADILCFNIWGKHHAWSEKSHITTFTREEVDELLEEIEKTHAIISFKELEFETPTKKDPHTKIPWHEFDIVAKKKVTPKVNFHGGHYLAGQFTEFRLASVRGDLNSLAAMLGGDMFDEIYFKTETGNIYKIYRDGNDGEHSGRWVLVNKNNPGGKYYPNDAEMYYGYLEVGEVFRYGNGGTTTKVVEIVCVTASRIHLNIEKHPEARIVHEFNSSLKGKLMNTVQKM